MCFLFQLQEAAQGREDLPGEIHVDIFRVTALADHRHAFADGTGGVGHGAHHGTDCRPEAFSMKAVLMPAAMEISSGLCSRAPLACSSSRMPPISLGFTQSSSTSAQDGGLDVIREGTPRRWLS